MFIYGYMVFLWFSYGFSMIFWVNSAFSQGFPMVSVGSCWFSAPVAIVVEIEI
jgi:hypothetical protein